MIKDKMQEQSKPLLPPYPYFGGKRKIAPVVWQLLGSDVPNYLEPCAGGLSVLLARPNYQGQVETINELNPYIVNFWRAIKGDPEQVAFYADNPVFEVDLHAKHLWLVNQFSELKSHTLTNPDYYDVKIAGWWVWGAGSWIGRGWCVSDKSLWQQIPHLSSAGQGINSKADLNSKIVYLKELANHLQYTRVICGDWSRVMGNCITELSDINGIFLDPPYVKYNELYGKGLYNVAQAVLDWCKINWCNPKLRIVLCGYEGELDVPSDWSSYTWKANKGYQTRGNDDSHLERLWYSPACLPLNIDNSKQLSLF